MALRTQQQAEDALRSPAKPAKRIVGLCRSCSQRRNASKGGPSRAGKTLDCAVCGRAFYATPGAIASGRRFCSKRCSSRAKVKLQTCTVCGKQFGPASPPRKTCSPDCRSEASRRALRGRMSAQSLARGAETRVARRSQFDATVPGERRLICERPGCENIISGQRSMYCSPSCHYADRKRRRKLVQAVHRCPQCGSQFRWNGRGKGIFCSLPCSRAAGGAHGFSVEVVIPRVVNGHHTRRQFADPSSNCRRCGNWAVHQHHVVYRQHIERVGGDRWHPDDALSLCRDCHTAAHMHNLPLGVLRDENFSFARDLFGAGKAYEYLRRRYVGEDPRLDQLEREYPVEAA